MENKLNEIKTKVERVLSKYTELLREHDLLLQSNQSIRSQFDEIYQKNELIETQNQDLTQKIQDLKIRVDELTELNETLVQNSLKWKGENSVSSESTTDLFSSAVSNHFSVNNEWLEKVQILEDKITGLKGDNDILRMNLSRKDAFILQLETEKRQLKIKISDLEEEIALKENTIEIQKNTLNELKEQNKLIKLAKEMSPDKNNNHDLKIKINEIVRDIDRCIDLLNE